MKLFDKNSEEHKGNGLYEIDGDEFMSIWAFKNEYHIPNNVKAINEKEGLQLIADGVINHICITEIGSSDRAHIYPTDYLMQHYAGYSEDNT